MVTATLISHEFSEGSWDEATSLVERFELVDDSALFASVPDAIDAAQAAAVLPRVGAAWAGTFSASSIRQTLRCRRIDASCSGELSSRIAVAVQWDSLYSFRVEMETARLVPRRHVVHQLTPFDLYRSLADCTLPTGTSGGSGDIVGTKLDEGGRPIRHFRQQAAVVVNYRLDSIATVLDTVDDALRSNLGKLCSVSILGYPAHSLLLQSTELTHERDEYWNVGLRILFDPLFHWVQDAEADGDGVTKLTAGKAAVVRWKRDLPAADWSSLLGDAYFAHRARYGEKVYP